MNFIINKNAIFNEKHKINHNIVFSINEIVILHLKSFIENWFNTYFYAVYSSRR